MNYYLRMLQYRVLALSWLWLIFHAALSTYTLSYEYAWKHLMGHAVNDMPVFWRTGNVPLAVCIIVFSALLKLAWISCWLPCLYYTWVSDRSWTSGSTTKLIMQADRYYETLPSSPRDASGNLVIGTSGRPRQCTRCNRKCGDRVYHDSAVKRCRPLFDHFCYYILVSVYLRTMKLYLYMLLLLPLDLIFTMVLSVLAMIQSIRMSVLMFFTPLVTATFLVRFLVVENSWLQWNHLAWNNEIVHEYRERGRKPITLVFKVEEGQGTFLQCKSYADNPWDLGPMANIRQCLGETWPVMLWPWITPAPVTNYFSHRIAVTDFPFRESVWRDRDMFINAPSGSTGVTVEGSRPYPDFSGASVPRLMAIDFSAAPAPTPARQQLVARLLPPTFPSDHGRINRRRAARSSGLEVPPRRHGDTEQ